ncbi:putative membrane protein [Chryseobacterium ginsenosidimutans]|uniref:Membrane protein n=1 Tax=Chryseobacterium geocarposphaerae TaxID=1416776 RepID=A0ABU1LCX6_9FLAO|nr:putative membrane protein [Chryseobacterium geocarposphaerae]MDR6698318.1 putative membrane protein [Chryseobacterium ginsenosidimutans]
MDFIIKLLHTVLFGGIFYILFMKYNRIFSIKILHIFGLLIGLIILFYLNTTDNSTISNRLLFTLLVFSLSIIILNVMKNFINMENNSLLKNSDKPNNYKNIKNIVFEKIIPVMIFSYQLLLIWFPAIFEKMSQK